MCVWKVGAGNLDGSGEVWGSGRLVRWNTDQVPLMLQSSQVSVSAALCSVCLPRYLLLRIGTYNY